MKSPKPLWILEDDPGAQFVYEEILGIRYPVRIFPGVSQLAVALESEPDVRPELLIADLRLPGESFLSFLSTPERRKLLNCPFMVVSSVDDLDALRMCFSEGAVDYITKPFGKGELIVKVERIFEMDTRPAEVCDLEIDPTVLRVFRNGQWSSPLTSKEFQILTSLRQAQNQTLSRDEMVRRIWDTIRVSSKTLDVHLVNLRRKLAPLSVEIQFKPPNLYRLLRNRVD